MQATLAGTAHYAEFGMIAATFLMVAATVIFLMWLINFINGKLDGLHMDKDKARNYECGEAPVGGAWFRFNNRFYLVAILFLIFDVGVVLLLPVLVRFTRLVAQGQGLTAIAAVLVFAGALTLGLVYAGLHNDLAWNKKVKESSRD